MPTRGAGDARAHQRDAGPRYARCALPAIWFCCSAHALSLWQLPPCLLGGSGCGACALRMGLLHESTHGSVLRLCCPLLAY